MDHERATGNLRNVGGRIEQGLGYAAEEARARTRAPQRETAGKAPASSSFEQALRETIRERPIASMLAALAIGWLLGRR